MILLMVWMRSISPSITYSFKIKEELPARTSSNGVVLASTSAKALFCRSEPIKLTMVLASFFTYSKKVSRQPMPYCLSLI